MSFNVVNLKHRDAPEVWLHIKSENGELMYDAENNPIRIKFKSIHSDAFRKSFFKLNVRLSQLKNNKQSEYESIAASGGGEISTENAVDDITTAFLDAEDLAIDMITELSVNWQGFTDQDGNDLAFDPDIFRFVVSQIENYHVFKQIRDALKNDEAFTVA